MSFSYRSAPFGASDDTSRPGSVMRTEQRAPVGIDTGDAVLRSCAKATRDLDTCRSRLAGIPVWAQVLLWIFALLLVPIVVWGIYAIVQVTQVSQGMNAARADLQRLRFERAALEAARERMERRAASRALNV